ncbi:MAG: M48 family metallopeptidase [Verrucomicrobiota bacterium]
MTIKRLGRILWFLGAPVLLPLLLSSCGTLDAVTGRNVYNMYTVQDDVQLGQDAIKANLEQLHKQGVRVNADPSRMAQFSNIVQRIVAVSDMPQLPYEITLVHTSIVNACAMPGGQMMVFEGLYDPKEGLVRDEDELAAVLAHEIAHVNCRHSTEELSKIMTAAMIAELAATVADHNDKGDVATAIRALFVVGSALWVPKHSRGDEAEADRVSLFYMAKAGFDPRAAPRIWQRAKDKKKDEGVLANALSVFNTHPSSDWRYRELSKMLPYAMEEYAKTVGSYPSDYNPTQAPMVLGPTFDWRVPNAKK